MPLYIFTDIDDCEMENHCGEGIGVCENTFGHYNCICKDGYVFDQTTCTSKLPHDLDFTLRRVTQAVY